jgi:hypothetical protein
MGQVAHSRVENAFTGFILIPLTGWEGSCKPPPGGLDVIHDKAEDTGFGAL